MLLVGLLFWGLSHALVATELSSAIPEEGQGATTIRNPMNNFQPTPRFAEEEDDEEKPSSVSPPIVKRLLETS